MIKKSNSKNNKANLFLDNTIEWAHVDYFV